MPTLVHPGRGCPNEAHKLLCILLLAAFCVLTACTRVNLKVEPFVSEPYPPRPEDAYIDILRAEPARHFVKIGRVTATSEYADEEELQDKIVSAARKLGADAVILGKADEIESTGLGQTYQTTISPEIQQTAFGGLGTGSPSFIDPYTYVQGADRVEYTLYQSGVAIRYH